MKKLLAVVALLGLAVSTWAATPVAQIMNVTINNTTDTTLWCQKQVHMGTWTPGWAVIKPGKNTFTGIGNISNYSYLWLSLNCRPQTPKLVISNNPKKYLDIFVMAGSIPECGGSPYNCQITQNTPQTVTFNLSN